MEPRSKEELLLKKGRAQRTLGFRSTKNLLQLQQKGLTSTSKTRRLLAETEQKVQATWPPDQGNKSITKSCGEKLPEKLLLLEELYSSMEAAISLLRIRHDICTFSTIAGAVESSSRRRFLRSHLAQIKHILPEALQVEEHISWDAESQCSRRDLRITLHPILKEETLSVKRYKSPQKAIDMVMRRREFHRRLLEFHLNNKEIGLDVPQAPLFGGVAASCHAEHNAEPLETLPVPAGDFKKTGKVCTLNEKDEVFQTNDHQLPNAEECELAPLPIGFNLNQLKKYPRSPSKLPRHQRVSPVPLHGPMSHLPSLFKPHFSAKRQTADSSEALEEAATFFGGVEGKPQFSLKRSKKAVVPPVPATPCKELLQATTPKKHVSVCDVTTPSLNAATMPKSALVSSPPDLISMDCSRTPAQKECPDSSTSFSSPLSKTPACTPQQAILTPSASITPSIVVTDKEAKDRSVKARKQAVIKSLRFGTPTKHRVQDKASLVSEEEATPMAVSDSFLSPIKSPANDFSSAPRKASSNVTRALPFNSPIVKKTDGPGLSSHQDTMHTPKRVKLSCRQLSELEPSQTVKEEVRAEKSEIAVCADEGHTSNFVDLSTITCADKLSASDMEILKCLPQELLNDVQGKERKQQEDKRSGIEKTRRRQQLIAGLPKLFNMVRLIFQSGNRTVLMRKDLTKMVLSSHPDITDRGEIVEQLQLLVELAPEWISVNPSSTGDLLYRINKNANMRAVSKALVDAKEFC